MHSIEICRDVIKTAEKIHQALGPSLFRETYTVCLAMELSNRGYQVQTKRARSKPNGVDKLYVNNLIRIDVHASNHNPETEQAVRVKKGSSKPINLYLNFATKELMDTKTKESLFSDIVSIADVAPASFSKNIQ